MSANPTWPSRAKGYKAIHPTQHIAGAAHNFVVSTEELARIIDQRVDELDAELGFALLDDAEKKKAGAVKNITACAATASHGTFTEEALARRMWSIRAREGRAVKVEIADALLSGAGVMIEDTDLATLPAGPTAAREAVDVHREIIDPDLDDLTARRLEKSLLHFAQGYIHDFNVIDQNICRGLELLFGNTRVGKHYARQLALV